MFFFHDCTKEFKRWNNYKSWHIHQIQFEPNPGAPPASMQTPNKAFLDILFGNT